MKIGAPIIVMNMKNLQPIIQRRNKILKINSYQIGMSRIKAESQHLPMIPVIHPVDPLRCLFRITAWPLYQMTA